MLIESWLIIPYVMLVCLGWFVYNIYWMEGIDFFESDAAGFMVFSIILGVVWGVGICVYTFHSEAHNTNLIYWEYGPLVLLSFFGSISLFRLCHEKNMVNYYYVMYMVPVLLTLTLFFL